MCNSVHVCEYNATVLFFDCTDSLNESLKLYFVYSISLRAPNLPFDQNECGTVPNPQFEAKRVAAQKELPIMYRHPGLWLKLALAATYGFLSATYHGHEQFSLGLASDVSITSSALLVTVWMRELYDPVLKYKPFFVAIPASIFAGVYATIAKEVLRDEKLGSLQYSVPILLVYHAMFSLLPFINLSCSLTDCLHSSELIYPVLTFCFANFQV